MGRKPGLTAIQKAKISSLKNNGKNNIITQTANAIGRSRHIVRSYIYLGTEYGLITYKKRKGSLTEMEKKLLSTKPTTPAFPPLKLKLS